MFIDISCNPGNLFTFGTNTRHKEKTNDKITVILLTSDDIGYSYCTCTHYNHIVYTHPDILGVIQSWNIDMTGLPGKEATNDLKKTPDLIYILTMHEVCFKDLLILL